VPPREEILGPQIQRSADVSTSTPIDCHAPQRRVSRPAPRAIASYGTTDQQVRPERGQNRRPRSAVAELTVALGKRRRIGPVRSVVRGAGQGAMTTQEADIRAGIAAGKPDWAAIRPLYEPKMISVARSTMRSRGYSDEAILGKSDEDIVSDLLTDFQENGIDPGIKHLGGYLNRATRNRTIDLLRQAGYDQPLPDPERIKLEHHTKPWLLRPAQRTRRTTTSEAT
jgi:hypothetical protein